MTNKKNKSAGTTADLQRGGDTLNGEYTSYGYIGLVDDELIEVVSESELYELLDDDDDEM